MYKIASILGFDLPPLETVVVGRAVIALESTPSTNLEALLRPRDGAVYVARVQTAGRGRRGNTWHSAPDLGLWFSVSLKGTADGLSFAGALAVRRALQDRLALTVKWPNDVLIGERKVCGVLVEHRDGWNALGIGLNVHHTRRDFPEELREIAGSLESESGERWDRGAVLHAVLIALDEYLRRLRAGGFLEIYEEWVRECAILGKIIQRDGILGQVTAIDQDGALWLKTGQGMKRIASGEISLV